MIKDTNFSKSLFLADKLGGTKGMQNITILKSIFGHLKTSWQHQINISECKTDGSTKLEESLIDVTSCEVQIVNCTFYNKTKANSGAAILKSINSHVKIISSNFYKNDALDGLLQIQNKSHLHLESSTFTSNGNFLLLSSAIITVQSNSTVCISICTFAYNTGFYGSCLFCDNNTTVITEKTYFTSNLAVKGGVIFCSAALYEINVDKSTSKYKYFSNWKRITSYEEENVLLSKLVINDCHFLDNTAYNKGGVLFIHGSSFQIAITSSRFSNNAAFYKGGSMYIQGTSALSVSILINDCEFKYCGVFAGGAICAKQAMVKIYNSLFTTTQGGYIVASQHSIVFITNCTLKESTDLGGYIYIYQSVVLKIENSIFDTSNFIAGAYIDATDTCSVTIIRSYFTNGIYFGFYTIVLNIQNNINLIVADSIFDGINLNVLSASQNITVSFTNCTFHKISGVTASHNARVNIMNSRITECLNIYQLFAFIEISDNSHLNISDTNITGNHLSEDRSFVNIQRDSTMILSNCFYERNSMPSHLIVSGNTYVTISNCSFSDNTVVQGIHTNVQGFLHLDKSLAYISQCSFTNTTLNVNAAILSVKSSQISVQGSIFEYNYYTGVFLVGTALVTTQSSKSLILIDSSFSNNIQMYFTVQMVADKTMANSYLFIKNCSFEEVDADSIYTENIKDIIILHSSFQYSLWWIGERMSINIRKAQSVRLWKSTFHKMRNSFPFYFRNDPSVPHSVELFTWNSMFYYEKTELKTNADNFLTQAKSLRFITKDSLTKIFYEEISYTSRKYLFIDI